MANFSTTYSGDFTSYVAGKIFSAANMAKEEKERRKEEGLNQAQPGSLFGRALQHEFGGDLYNRTFGIFDPRKKHDETDRKSSKEARFTAQFPKAEKKEEGSTKKKNVKSAKQGLLAEDNDSVPVKDKDLRQQISKIFGAGIDARLVASEHKLSRVSQNIVEVKQGLVKTHQLVIDQNTILLSKFDQILEIFGKQAEFQEKLKDKAEAQQKESQIEEQKDLSSARKLISTSGGSSGTEVSSRVAQFYLRRGLRQAYRNLPKSVRQTRTKLRNIQRAPGRAVNRITSSAANALTNRLPPKAANFTNNIRTARATAAGLQGVRNIKNVGKNVPGLKQALAVWEYGDRKAAGQSNLQAAAGVGGGLAGAAAGAAIGTMLFPGVGTVAGLLIGAAFSAGGAYAGSKIADTVTGVHETGTGMTKPGTGLLHGKELILGTTDRKDIKNSYIESLRDTGSMLVSSAVALGEATGQGRQVRAEANKLGLDYTIYRMPLKTDIGKATKARPETKLLALFTNPFSALREQMQQQEAEPRLPPGQRYKLGDESGGSAELRAEVEKAASELGIPAPDLLGVILAESGGDPSKYNQFGCAGLIQFCPDVSGGTYKTIGGERIEISRLASMTIPQQMEYVKKYLKGAGVKPGMSGYDVYSAIHAGRPGGNVTDANGVTTRGYYESNVLPLIQKAQRSSTIIADLGNFSPPTGDARITIDSAQGVDASGEPGLDFSAADIRNNYAVFPGRVVDSKNTGGYGWDVVIRSEDPSKPGTYFDALYAHFPNKDSIKVKPGDTVTAGQHLGPVGWDFKNNRAYPEAGNMTGPHTSLDFFPAGGPYTKGNPYPNWRTLVNGLLAAGGRGGSNPAVSSQPAIQPGAGRPGSNLYGPPTPDVLAAEQARSASITKALAAKGTIPFTHDGKPFFFRVHPDGRVEAFKPKNVLGYQESIDLSKNKALRNSINQKIQSMYGRQPSGAAARGYGNGGIGGNDSGAVTSKTSLIRGGIGGPGRTITAEQRALLKTISFAEGTTGSYGTIFGGKIVPELEQGIMTVREVYNMMMSGRVRGRNAGYAKGSYATGRYQLMPDTLWDLVKAGHVNWSEKMTHQLQDYLILKRMETFRGVSGSDLKRQGLSRGIMDKLSGEFASFPTYSGASAYGQPVKSHDTLQKKYDSILRQILLEQKKQQELERQRKLKEEAQRRNIFNQIQNILPGGMKGLIPSQLLSDSSVMEDMEEEAIRTQFVIINNVVASTEKSSSDMSLSSVSQPANVNDYSESYRMAILGAV